MIGLHHFFLEMSKKSWPRFRVRNSPILPLNSHLNVYLGDEIAIYAPRALQR
jgi:hypothetical protein